MPEPKLFQFSTHIGAVCNQKSRTFNDLAERLGMDVTDLMRQCNGQAPPSKALVKGFAKELDISESVFGEVGRRGSKKSRMILLQPCTA